MGQLFTHLAPIWSGDRIIGTLDRPKFDFSGIPLTYDHASKFINAAGRNAVLAGEITHSGEPVVHIFDSQEAFQDWARKTRFAQHFLHIEGLIARTREQARQKKKFVPEQNFDRIQIASNVNMDFDRIFGTEPRQVAGDSHITLFSGEAFSGKEVVIGSSALDDLRDVEFYQRTRSLSVHGVCLLTDDVLFGGFRFYVIGDPFVSIANLHKWHFDRAAASAIIV